MQKRRALKFATLITTSVLCWLFVIGMIVYAQAATLQITWTPNTEPDLAGYKIYMGTATGQYGLPQDVGNVTSRTITLTPTTGATYYFALTAYDTSGNESGYSDEVSVFIPDATAPAKPTGLMQRLIAWLKGLFGWA